MKKLSVKYLAGLIDGEACIDWSHYHDKKYNKRYVRPRLRITLTAPGYEIIESLMATYGGHIETRTPTDERWAQSKTWYVVSSRAIMVLNQVKNSLIIKKEQAKLAIAWEKHFKGTGMTEEAREILKEEMKLMKKDPHRLSEKAVQRVKLALKR